MTDEWWTMRLYESHQTSNYLPPQKENRVTNRLGKSESTDRQLNTLIKMSIKNDLLYLAVHQWMWIVSCLMPPRWNDGDVSVNFSEHQTDSNECSDDPGKREDFVIPNVFHHPRKLIKNVFDLKVLWAFSPLLCPDLSFGMLRQNQISVKLSWQVGLARKSQNNIQDVMEKIEPACLIEPLRWSAGKSKYTCTHTRRTYSRSTMPKLVQDHFCHLFGSNQSAALTWKTLVHCELLT